MHFLQIAQLLLYLVGFPEKMVIMPTNPQGPKPQCMLGWGSPWCTAICPLVYKHICTITQKNIAKMYACIHSPAKPACRNVIMHVVPNYIQSVHIHTHTNKLRTQHTHHMAWFMTSKHGETHIQTFIHAWSSSDACACRYWWAILSWMEIKQRRFLKKLKKKPTQGWVLQLMTKALLYKNAQAGVTVQGVYCWSAEIPIRLQKHHNETSTIWFVLKLICKRTITEAFVEKIFSQATQIWPEVAE